MRDLAYTGVFVFFGMLLIVLLSLKANETLDKIALVFPVGTTQEEVMTSVSSVGGRIIGFSALDNIVIASFDLEQGAEAISKTKALFTMDPAGFGGCSGKVTKNGTLR